METRFENITVDTEKQLRTINTTVYKQNTTKSLLILLGFALASALYVSYSLWGIPINMIDLQPYLLVAALYAFYIVKIIREPGRAAQKHYVRKLGYYDNSIPPVTHRFYDDYFVSSDVDSTHITPYHKLRKVLRKENLLILIRQDGKLMYMTAEGFTQGTLEQCLQFIETKAPQAFQPQQK